MNEEETDGKLFELWRIRLILLPFIRILQTENLELKVAQLSKFSVIKKGEKVGERDLEKNLENLGKNQKMIILETSRFVFVQFPYFNLRASKSNLDGAQEPVYVGDFSLRVLDIKKNPKITQAELSKIVGINEKNIRNIENSATYITSLAEFSICIIPKESHIIKGIIHNIFKLKRSLQNYQNFSKRTLKEQNLAVLEVANFACRFIQSSLKEKDILKRIGSDKGGHWEVVKKHGEG